MSLFRDACKPYFLFFPYMSNKPRGAPDNNTVLYTCGHYFSILKRLGELDPEIDEPHFRLIHKEITIAPGRYKRGPNKLQHTAHDDIIGLSRGAQLLAPDIASEIYLHGLNNDWVYNNTGKRDAVTLFKSWHWRIMGTSQHYKLCNDKQLTPFDEFAFSADKISTNFKPFSATSGRLLDLLKIWSYNDSSFKSEKCDDIEATFWGSINAKYKNGISDIYAKFFSKQHPFSIFTK